MPTHIPIRRDGRITQPGQLRGARVGCSHYSPNILVGARALLDHQFGIQPRELRWFEATEPEPGELRPADVRIERIVVPSDFRPTLDITGEEELDARALDALRSMGDVLFGEYRHEAES